MCSLLVRRQLRRLVVLFPALALVAAAFAPMLALAPSVAARAMDDSTILHIRDLDSPAVVRIVTEVDAQLICHGCGQSGTDFRFPQDSAFPGNVYADIFSGSGAFISADGYILTAEHVVDQNCSDSLNAPNFVNIWEQDLQNNYQSYGFNSANDAVQFAQNELNQNVLSLQCGNHATTVFPTVEYTGPLQSPGSLVLWPMTQVVASSPVDQQDTAVIKVDVQHDMPYLALAPQSAISVGETITGIAFPGDADQSDFSILLYPTQANADVNTLNSLLSPSTDTGQLTNQQTRSDGTLTYETSGTGYHGSSGGPAVDNQGRIVGFYDYTPDANSNRVAVLVSSAVAAKYAQQAGIAKPTAGSVMPLWTQAISDYYGTGPCHFGQAYKELAQLKDQHPEFGGAELFYLQAEKQQTPAACAASQQHGPSMGLIALLVALGIIVLGGGAGGYVLFQRKRTQSARVPVAAGVSSAGAAPMPVFSPVGTPPTMMPLAEQPTLYSSGPDHPLISSPVSPMSNGIPSMMSSQPQTPNAGLVAPIQTPNPSQAIPAQASMTPVTPWTPMPDGGANGSLPNGSLPNGLQPQNGASIPTGLSLPVSGPAQVVVSQPILAPLPTPAPIPAPSEPAAHICANGHRVADLTAHFCPECGAPVQTMARVQAQ